MSSRRLGILIAAVAATLLALAPAGAQAKPGDLLVLDAESDAILRVDPASGGVATVAQGPPLDVPAALAFAPDGSLLVADRAPTPNTGRLLRVDLATGAITIVVTGPPPGPTTGLAVAAGGEALVAAFGTSGDGVIVGIDPATGATRVITPTHTVDIPSGIVAAPDGRAFMTDEGSGDAVVQVDLATGAASPLAAGPPLRDPTGVDLFPNGALAVSDDQAGPSFRGAAFRLDPSTGGPPALLFQGHPTEALEGPAIAPDGAIYLVDSAASLPGCGSCSALFRLDPATGGLSTVASAGDAPRFVDAAIEPPLCRGRPATIVGSTANDRIVGSPFNDVIAVLGGKDRVNAGKGRDFVCGGAGKDKLKGGKGKDRLIGGGGKDTCSGGKGKDRAKSCERGKL